MIRELEWYEGVFLRPQHFQYQDNLYKARITSLTAFVDPYHYGVEQVSLNENALANNIVLFNQLRWRTHDGEILDIGQNAIVESRSIEEDIRELGDKTTIYVGMRKIKDDYRNSLQTEKNLELSRLEKPRFVYKNNIAAVYDIYRENSREELRFLTYNLQIFFSEEIALASEFDLIPVARMRRVGARMVFDTQFVPPCINLLDHTPLKKHFDNFLTEVVQRIEEKDLTELVEAKGILEAIKQNSISTILASALAKLDAARETGRISPYAFYSLVTDMLFSLSIYRKNDNPGKLISREKELRYQHYHPEELMRRLISYWKVCMDELTGGVDLEVEMEFDGSYFNAGFKHNEFDRCQHFYLEIRTTLPKDYVEEVIGENIKIGSRQGLPRLVSRSLPGIELKRLDVSGNSRIPIKSGSVYFELDTMGELWKQAREEENISVYIDSVPSDIRFFVVGLK